MKYGIISDIHGNLEALISVLPFISKVDKIVVLGDIVGYGPCPNECCDEVKKLNAIVIAGNHDLASIGAKDISWFNPYAKEAIEWTANTLTAKNKEYLANIPKVVQINNLLFAHGSLRDYTDEYIFNEITASLSFSLLGEKILFVGHTHVPATFFLENNIVVRRVLKEDEKILIDKKAIVNPGSIGQPRDYNPKASFGIFDTSNNEFFLFRIRYNVKRIQRLMMNEGLPKYLIERLEAGR
ncbi:TPA: metallophosphoesterase [bacterium]|nr:metallophosphoesterase [bacterium]